MDYNIVSKYISFLKREYLNLFNIVFHTRYQKKICEPFLDIYIGVRYYNETDFHNIKDFVARINKELVTVYEKLKIDNDEELLKDIVALFAYIVYFDDVYKDTDISIESLINNLLNDKNIKISKNPNLKELLLNWYKSLEENKKKFNNSLESKEFVLNTKKVSTKIWELKLDHNIKISNLYSEYAINKAYNSVIVDEDKEFIIAIMASSEVLNNAIKLDFTKSYVFELVTSIIEKEKKLKRLFSVIDNPLTKKYISVKITYEDYLKYKNILDSYIVDGFSFSVVLDSKFEGNIRSLVLFSSIYITKENKYYNDIMCAKKETMPKIIVY